MLVLFSAFGYYNKAALNMYAPPMGMESINYGLLSVDYHLAFIYLNTNTHQKY